MPDFYVDDISIDPDDYVSACDSEEIEALIDCLIDSDFLPKNIRNNIKENQTTRWIESEFKDKMYLLAEKYHNIASEDEEILEKLFKKYI